MSSYIYQLLTDFIVFKLVDSFAKSAIYDATNDMEKKRIWFYESGFLAVISLPIYLLDHTPYLLWLLTGCTFLFTQLLGQLHLLYWWNLLKTRWDEHLQHQESLERLQNTTMTTSPSLQPAPAISSPVSAAGGASTVQTFSSYPLLPQHPSPVSTYDHLLSNTTPVASQQYGHQNFANDLCSQQAAFLPSFFPANNNIMSPHKPRLIPSSHHSSNSAGFYPENVTVCPGNTLSSPVRVHWAHNVLRRRPLRPNAVRSPLASPNLTLSQTRPYVKKDSPFRERLLSVFGLSSKSPPGLENNGQNLCFMNCILQCLARTPFLVSSLSAVDVDQMAGCSREERQFLCEFISILSLCSAQPQSGTYVLDTKRLKSASQLLKCSLLNEHSQQDAAEFLMWLLTTSHTILNKISVEDYCKRTEINSKLACLKALYGEINSSQIKHLRMSCQEQIDKASGLDTESYAKIAQRLSDLDWLSYKRENASVIDDLYTGQLVEAYNCSRKGHISVQTQTFAVLPVPIGEPTNDSHPTANVYLEDCFTELCSVEHLSEQICSLCAKNRNEYLASTTAKTPATALTSPIMSPHITARMNLQTSAFSLGSFMSPILGDIKDTYQTMGLQRTSTPRNFGLASEKQDLERRCLLHQLPECLIIQLLRFTFDSQTKETKKITTPVSVTLSDLDLKNIVFDLVTNNDDNQQEPSYTYDLYAVCVHLSNHGTSSGHYISYCLHTNSKWYKFDDDHVTEVDQPLKEAQ